MRTYIGIDPGKNGGLAWIDDAGAHALPMPQTIRARWLAIAKLETEDCYCCIEKVHTSPQMGVRSAGTFMQNTGELLASLCAAGIPYEEVSPAKWQRHLSCLTAGDKNVTKQKAQGLFPGLKITHAIADALLIAEYCRQTRNYL